MLFSDFFFWRLRPASALVYLCDFHTQVLIRSNPDYFFKINSTNYRTLAPAAIKVVIRDY